MKLFHSQVVGRFVHQSSFIYIYIYNWLWQLTLALSHVSASGHEIIQVWVFDKLCELPVEKNVPSICLAYA